MNLIAGALLSELDEEEAFWMLATMIESRTGYYVQSMIGLEVDERVLMSCLSYHAPDIADQLRRLEVAVESFSVSWLVCCFMESPLPLEACLQVWDALFVFGDELMFALSLAILKRSVGNGRSTHANYACQLRSTLDFG